MLIEFQQRMITFPSTAGRPQSAEGTFVFSTNIRSSSTVAALINGSAMGFTANDHTKGD
jgi:hypothetical protein